MAKVSDYTIKKTSGGYGITRDDMALRTPQKHPLIVPTQGFAEAVVQELAQAKKFSLTHMPLTAIAFTAIDVAREHAGKMVSSMLAFAETDLLLYRSEVEALAKRQQDGWDPVLAWLKKRYDCALLVTDNVMPMEQPEASVARLKAALASFDAFTMAAFSVLAQAFGSLVLAMAVKEGEVTAEKAFALSRLEEDFQAEKWGEDSVAMARAADIRRDAQTAERALQLLRA